MVRWLRWHCPPDTGFEIRALAVWGRARYLSFTEAPHNTDFHTWMGKKKVLSQGSCFHGYYERHAPVSQQKRHFDPSVVLMLDQRLRWPSIKTTLGQRSRLAVMSPVSHGEGRDVIALVNMIKLKCFLFLSPPQKIRCSPNVVIVWGRHCMLRDNIITASS